MKRLVIFVLLGPFLFVLCIVALFLPFASLVAGAGVRFDIEVESYTAVLLGLLFGGFVLALVDWLAEMLAMRPWFTGAAGWAIGALTMGALLNLSQPVWWWFAIKGLLVGTPALVCSWLIRKMQRRGAAAAGSSGRFLG